MAGNGRFDIVIVGAGAAGCVLARRLSEDPHRHVALLEAGPDYGPDPAAWPEDLRYPDEIFLESHSWGYLHAARPTDRPLPLPRARVVGGSSTVNGCIWLRGSAADYDGWAALGNPGWSFAELLPYFKRSESDPLGGPLHGTDGPVPVQRVAETDLSLLDQALVAAAAKLGFPWVADLNGELEQRPCVGPTPKNVADGVRMHAAFTYLAPARPRSNLTLIPDTFVDRICIEDGHAVGVVTADGRMVHAREVVVCAGAYGSPAILLRSGIGPATDLQELGIPIVANRPGVGAHLLDHPRVTVNNGDEFAPYVVNEKFAPVSDFAVATVLKARSRQTLETEEVDLYIIHGHYWHEDRERWVAWFELNLDVAPSRGRVRLTSTDPNTTLDIDHAYFSDLRELEACCDGVELIERLVATRPLLDALEPIPSQVPVWENRDALRAWVHECVATSFHPSSTCRMGPASDPEAVVDHAGRVYGVTGLRVVDASVFPTGLRANPHCTVVAVAEQLADVIRHEDRA
jgi:choline dehydrogenase